jgi:amino acid transporter
MERKPWWSNLAGKPWWFNIATGAALLILAEILEVVMRDHYPTTYTGWTNTQYDFVEVLASACWICGVILVLVGLIRLWRKPPEADKPKT